MEDAAPEEPEKNETESDNLHTIGTKFNPAGVAGWHGSAATYAASVVISSYS